MSGKSWRQWADDDEVGDDGLGGLAGLGDDAGDATKVAEPTEAAVESPAGDALEGDDTP